MDKNRNRFEFLCRICIEEKNNMQRINDYIDKFEVCTKISISVDDNLPHYICDSCIDELIISYNFVDKSVKSNEYLHKIIKIRDKENSKFSNNITELSLEVCSDSMSSHSSIDHTFYNLEKSSNDSNDNVSHKQQEETEFKKVNLNKLESNKETDLDDHRDNQKLINQCKGMKNKQNGNKFGKLHKQIKHLIQRDRGCIKCKICDLMTQNFSTMILHLQQHAIKQSYFCATCDQCFMQKSSLKTHIKHCHSIETTKVEKDYTCENCGKIFTSKNNLKIHLRIHTGEMPYECGICSKRFMQLGTLISHKRRHTGEKPYVCKLCSKAFVELNHLKRHQSVHSEEKPYVCNICGKGVKSSYALKQHSKLHTNEKEHICDKCGISFLVKGNLDAHIRVVHSERSGQCTICQKICSNLADHMIKHSGEKLFQCEICSKRFAHSRGLLVHSRQHTSANKFKCNIEGCNQSFYAQWVLECHILKHNGRTPFSCQFCSKGFLRICHLTKHMKLKHPNESNKFNRPENAMDKISLIRKANSGAKKEATK